jgi:flavin reductase (DIM6/NTAB) family NADH-FMN oxidoreductase RutF
MAEPFRRIPYGIYVLTTKQGTHLWALIVSWVSQVSYSPPLLMVALRRNRKVLPAIRESGFFSLSLLKKEQISLIPQVKGTSPESVSSLFSEEKNPKIAPFLRGCLAFWDCLLVSAVEAGDHVLFIGEVRSASTEGKGDPLTTMDYGKTYIGQS